MQIAVISDIHGNLEALNAVFEHIRGAGIEQVYCLGDIVGYGPNPNECVEMIAENARITVIGNHDHAVLGLTSTEYFNDFAKISTYWTSNALSKNNRDFLAGLNFTQVMDDALLVHATPSDPPMWHYILSEMDARFEFDHFDQKICFIGHSHFPIVFSPGGFSRRTKQKLDEHDKYIVNVGSVGQPRDGNPKACFCVYDKDSQEIEYVRLSYDVDNTRAKIIQAGLPVFLAERLTKGY
jgi:diadenosine tetraphosphatase ApaH/serine/threonine PP2A family protein phosphatase